MPVKSAALKSSGRAILVNGDAEHLENQEKDKDLEIKALRNELADMMRRLDALL